MKRALIADGLFADEIVGPGFRWVEVRSVGGAIGIALVPVEDDVPAGVDTGTRVQLPYRRPDGGLAVRVTDRPVYAEVGDVTTGDEHPERAIETELGSSDGRALFESVVRGLVDA